ncbi:hypothetical protein [Streptomyces cucumeris]|uniref:hypothetical protein n=1 Tax=Streptomyces cucumeris TaxID=2962890 RepID=UPI003D7476F7
MAVRRTFTTLGTVTAAGLLAVAAAAPASVSSSVHWGNNDHAPFKTRITDDKDRGCAYSSASGAGSAKKIDLPEGKTINIRIVNWTGVTDGMENISFKNDH